MRKKAAAKRTSQANKKVSVVKKRKTRVPKAELPKLNGAAAIAYDERDEFDDDEDQVSDIQPTTFQGFRVYSRDWTLGTIVDQVEQENIDLQPAFQRRNAWTDTKRSALIESLILGIPVPQLVFAEDSQRPGGFIVIDGKQRLLAIAGFMYPETFDYWEKPVLRGLAVLDGLNGLSYAELKDDPHYADQLRRLTNSDIRCSVISAGSSDNMLYYVFYRLNSGSVTLSTQELRQALNRGSFTEFLVETSANSKPLHQAMSLSEADPRFRDTEVLLRYFAFSIRAESYSGNLREFLDRTLSLINSKWDSYKVEIEAEYQALLESISKLQIVLGESHIGKRFENGRFQGRFNRALFEVEVLYFKSIPKSIASAKRLQLRAAIEKLCSTDQRFVASITATTKSKEQYNIRFGHFAKAIGKVIPTRTLPRFEF